MEKYNFTEIQKAREHARKYAIPFPQNLHRLHEYNREILLCIWAQDVINRMFDGIFSQV